MIVLNGKERVKEIEHPFPEIVTYRGTEYVYAGTLDGVGFYGLRFPELADPPQLPLEHSPIHWRSENAGPSH